MAARFVKATFYHDIIPCRTQPNPTQPFVKLLIITTQGCRRDLNISWRRITYTYHVYGLLCDDVTEMKVHQKFAVTLIIHISFVHIYTGSVVNVMKHLFSSPLAVICISVVLIMPRHGNICAQATWCFGILVHTNRQNGLCHFFLVCLYARRRIKMSR